MTLDQALQELDDTLDGVAEWAREELDVTQQIDEISARLLALDHLTIDRIETSIAERIASWVEESGLAWNPATLAAHVRSGAWRRGS